MPLVALGGCSSARSQPQSIELVEEQALLAPLEPGHGSIEQLGGQGLALAGHRLDAAHDDWVLRDGAYQALVSRRKGQVIALGRRGSTNGLVAWRAEAFEGLGAMDMAVANTSADEDGRLLHIEQRGLTRAFTLHVWLRLDGPVLTMRSQLVAGPRPVLITLGETVSWGNTPSWLEGHGYINRGGAFGGQFMARESLGVAYASCSHDGPLLARFAPAGLAGFHRSGRTGERLVQVEAGRASAPRTVSLAISERSLGDAAAALPCAGEHKLVDVGEAANATDIEISHCEQALATRARQERAQLTPTATPGAASSSAEPLPPAGYPYARYALDGRNQLPLPALDCLRARLLAPGHEPGAWFDPLISGELGWRHPDRLPRGGTLKWQVRDALGKPLPAKVVVRGVGSTSWPDWGDDPSHGASRNFIYTLGDGHAPIPPGEHEVIISRGPEYSLSRQRISLSDRQAVEVKATLERVVDTAGWISADLHVHALPSFDAPAMLDDRVRSLAAVNVEVAVATDHNAVTDYRPTLGRLALQQHLAAMVGDEVTVDEVPLGHFNVFPLAPLSAPLPWYDITPNQLFSNARQRSIGGIIQINHPSMGSIGYLDLLHYDQRHVAAWRQRSPLADVSFDAIEVFNGDHYASIGAVREVMQDWFALLDAGVRSTATGNSDSHKVSYQEAGTPRNWVAVGDDDPAHFNELAFVSAIKQGRVIVSSGPFILFSIDDAGVGETLPPGDHELRVEIRAPAWIDVSEVRVLLRGQVIRTIPVSGDASSRLSHRERLTLRAGDWLIVEAEGRQPMPDLFRGSARPFAFTNPIWIK